MKNLTNLNSAEWCDIIFEGKNKSYGAFELRQSSSKRHIVAFGVVVLFAAVVSAMPAIISTINAATSKGHTAGIDETYVTSVIEVDNKLPEPEIAKPEIPEPPKFVKMTKFVPPTIVKNEDAPDETEMVNMSDVTEGKEAIGAFDVKDGSTDKDAIRKEFETDVIGDGKGGAAPKEPEIFVSAQFMPQYPGGEKEMYKYIYDQIKYPIVDQEMGIQGKVTVRFVVSKTGEITDIQLLKGISPTCDKEAIRVLKSMPRWIPGKNNGIAVPVYFTMPIVFKLN
ncbi:TonB family protein [Dysgonomonas sp. Marseille-P4677]|uniref:energy transducer TonB n=1 Tax=Dysgonomonas sp. Marseille-P4677 TaxID=2364790 RepID=UPI0019139F96|nr:energy transducer TonB [Dysgonomonas sp. Marseille-P4677]MBK5720583.1 TonB family protein [Dysgonomonas sp. Marseille-P4677]